MKVIIAGGTGQIGTILTRSLMAEGHKVVVLSRASQARGLNTVLWDGAAQGEWTAHIDGADVVINMAGRSVNCRYNAANRRDIRESRVNSTLAIGRAIESSARPPRVWLQASSATIYAHRFDAPNDDVSGILGGTEDGAPDTWQFSVGVVKAWEQAATLACVPNTRTVLLRSAMTMSPDRGGVFDVLLGLARRGLGGASGDGRQYVSWIHYLDFIRAIMWLIEHDISGPVNLAAPNPIPNSEFMQALRKACGVHYGIRANRLMLEIAARFLHTESELVLKSRRVIPRRLLESGFCFQFEEWPVAAEDLFATWTS